MKVMSTVSPNVGEIGDIFEVTIEASYDPGTLLTTLPEPKDFSPFEFRSYSVDKQDDVTPNQAVITYKVAAFETGETVIPTLNVGFERAGETMMFSLDALPVRIDSVLGGEKNAVTLAENEDPLPLTIDWGPYVKGALIWLLIMAILCGVGVWLFLRLKGRKPVKVAPEVIVDPKQEALDALVQLEAKKYADIGEFKLHYLELTDIVKTYLSHVCHTALLELTTDEVIVVLRSRLSEPKRRVVEHVLFFSDSVKFAKQVPTLVQHAEMLRVARQIIEGSEA